MNILECYIEEIHSVEPYTADWTSRFPDKEFVEIDVTTNCYGSKTRRKTVESTTDWAIIKERGYFWW